jgi:hypothetical protein
LVHTCIAFIFKKYSTTTRAQLVHINEGNVQVQPIEGNSVNEGFL